MEEVGVHGVVGDEDVGGGEDGGEVVAGEFGVGVFDLEKEGDEVEELEDED